jgi:medium-chain acyl-[acyl-carrier-protein] hydrolase
MKQRCLVSLKRSEHPQVRIISLPYAGGHAAFTQSWSPSLPEEVELLGIAYPKESAPGAVRSAQHIASFVLDEVLQYSDRPLILFGYSLGALIAYELSLLLARHAQQQPAELVVAACRAPSVPPGDPMTGLSDAQFIERLRTLGGTPQAVLDNAELLEFFLPLLRADIATAEGYEPSSTAALSCPITAISGNADATLQPAKVAGWEHFTRQRFRWHQLEGHHFFLQQRPEAVITIVREVAEQHVAARYNHLALRNR